MMMLLLAAKILGEICERLNYPSVLGYLGAGMLLGPIAASVAGNPLVPLSQEVMIFGELGAILLLFIAGLGEIHVEELLKNKIATVGSALLGYLFPLIAALFIASFVYVIDPGIVFSYPQIIVLVIAASCTSIMPSVRMLVQRGKMKTEIGRTIITSGILTDVAGLLVFMVFLTLEIVESAPIDT